MTDTQHKITLEGLAVMTLILLAVITFSTCMVLYKIRKLREQVEQIHAAQVLTNEDLERIEKQIPDLRSNDA